VVGQSVTGLRRGWGVPDAATYRLLGYILDCVVRPAGPVAQLTVIFFVAGAMSL
jgi:hypothetical protein